MSGNEVDWLFKVLLGGYSLNFMSVPCFCLFGFLDFCLAGRKARVGQKIVFLIPSLRSCES